MKKTTYFFATVIMLLLSVQIPQAYSAETDAQQKTLTILSEVIGLEMTKYDSEFTNYVLDNPDIFGGFDREIVKYSLQSEDSKVEVICTFIDGKLVRYDLSNIQGFPILSAQSANLIDSTKNALQLYQTYSMIESFEDYYAILDSNTDSKPVNKTQGSIKLQVTENDNIIDIVWINIINNVEFPTGLSVHFENDILTGFVDFSNFYKIGSSEVKISKEEAINIAKEQAKNFTKFQVSAGDGNVLEVTMNLLDEPIVTNLQIVSREAFTHYPFWNIRFYSEKEQYGVNGVEVGIWADTGEVAYSQPTGYMGINTEPTNNSIAETSISNETLLLVAIATLGICIVIAIFHNRNRRK